MKYFYLMSALLLAFLMFGCADSSTKGNVKDVDSKITINIHDTYGPIYLDPSLGFEYSQGDLAQDTSNTSDINPATQLKIPIAQGGSTSAVEGALDGVKSLLDNRVRDSNNKTDNSATNPTQDIGPGGDTGNIMEKVKTTESIYPTKYHHTLVGGTDGGVSFVGCPGQILDFEKCSCEGIDMPRHGWSKNGTSPPDNRQGWWQMFKEPKNNTDIICVTTSGQKYHYKIDKENVMLNGNCK